MPEELYNLIKPELLALIPVLYLSGTMLKKSAIGDHFIPALLGAESILFSILYSVSTMVTFTLQSVTAMLITALTQGILLAGTAVYTNQLCVQCKRAEQSSNEIGEPDIKREDIPTSTKPNP